MYALRILVRGQELVSLDLTLWATPQNGGNSLIVRCLTIDPQQLVVARLPGDGGLITAAPLA